MVEINKNKLTRIFLNENKTKKPLKRSTSGYETEQFVLNNDGSIDNSEILIKKAKAKKLPIQKECAKSMIELSCLPAKRLKMTSESMVDNHILLQEIAYGEDKYLYPFGTYFGNNNVVFRNKINYNIKKKVLGENRFKYAGYCCGCHQHYALPRGIFDKKNKIIKEMNYSKINKTLVDSFNFMTAIDPVLTTLTQSSPYFDNKLFAKNSRVIIYRGGKFLKFKDGTYSKHRLFGGLQQYKTTVRDLNTVQKRRFQKWKILVKKAGYDVNKHIKSEKILSYNWSPVKINPLGTLEYRGYDMNYLSTIFGASTLLKFSLREIQQRFKIVVPLDISIKESFKIENNMIFIPSFSEILRLQKKAAYYGLEDNDVYTYVKNFYNLAKDMTNKNYHPLLLPIKEIIDNRKTTSDEIIDYFKKKGFKNKINQSVAKEAAIYFSNKFRKDLVRTKNIFDDVRD
ncbi:MAG: hypothetical protein ACOC3X_01230 [Nanoarchaeota archaeon]